MKILKRIIIWFFEKYAYDYWVDIQNERERKEFQKKYNLKDNEVEQALIDKQDETCREAYDAGVNYGVERAYEQGCD